MADHRGKIAAPDLKQVAVAAFVAVVILLLGVLVHSVLAITVGVLLAGVALALGSAPAKSWRGWWVLALLTLLVASTLYGQLDGLLKTMHVFGTPSFGLSSLGARSGQPGAAATVVQSWFNWYGQPKVAELFASPRHVAYLTLAVDTFLLVPAYAAVLTLLLYRGRQVLRRSKKEAEATGPTNTARGPRVVLRSGYADVAKLSLTAVGVAVGADLIENAGYYAAVRYYWGNGAAPTWARLLIHTTGYFTLVKTLALLLALLGLVLVVLGLRDVNGYREKIRDLALGLKIVRGQIAILVLLVVALVIQPQAPDVIRRWNVRQGGVAIFLALAVASINWAFARRLLQPLSADRKRMRFRPSVMVWIGVGLAAVTLIAWGAGAPAWGLAIPAAFWLLMWLLGRLVKDPAPRTNEFPSFGRAPLARVVGTAALVLFGLAILRASVGPVILAKGGSSLDRLVGVGLGLVAGAWPVYLILRSVEFPKPVVPLKEGPFLRVMGVSLVIGGFLWWRLAANVWAVSDFMGTVGVLLLFLAMAAVVVGGLAMLAEWVEPPGAFQLLGLSRIPAFVLLLGWFVLSSILPVGAGFHDVRFLTVPVSATGVPPSFQGELTRPAQLLRRWLRDLPPGAFKPGPGGGRHGVPVIFVATAGGGVRAAYWTSLVLDCLFQPQPVPTPTHPCPGAPGGRDATSSIIVGSGISGGSVGLVDYVTHDVQVTEGRSDGPNWVRARLGGDYLAPSLAWQLAVELPRAFFRFDTGMDRAEAIERALQQSWVDGPWTPGWEHFLWQGSSKQDDGPLTQGFLDLWRRQATGPGEPRASVPLLVLNGTSVTDGCRVNTSALDANGNHSGQPGGDQVARQIGCLSTRTFDERTGQPVAEVLAATRDFDDYLCAINGQQRIDVRLSTASLLSARFPFVSPAGRITDCGSTGGQATYVVDGGYLDSSGAATAVELWRAMEPYIAQYNLGQSVGIGDPTTTCLVPFLIQIDNGYQEPAPAPPTKRPGELSVPIRTVFSARSAFTALARQDGAVLFNHAIPADGVSLSDRYAHFFPRGHPGVEAPLGWVLSNGAKDDLEAQIAENGNAIREVMSWLTGPLPCGP